MSRGMSEEQVKPRRKSAEGGESAALAESGGQLSVDGIEVTQVVQDMGHSVPLIAGKPTVVRLYLSRPSGGEVTVRGEISVRRTHAGAAQKVPSLDTARVKPSQNGKLRTKRHDLRLSLNFLLPDSLTNAGHVFVGVSSLTNAETGERMDCADCAEQRVEVRFVRAPPLRVRLVKLRYRTEGAPDGLLPEARDVDLFKSWLGRAYPVSRVEFSQVTADTKVRPPFKDTTYNRTNAQLTAMRNLDVSAGADQRTHYYGMVSDKGGFMRGGASALPDRPDPTAVASGPTGTPDPGWDTDGSYGDWYGGHELAHTFGRLHPGFCDDNSEDDLDYPFKNGQLSNGDGAFVGFDFGDQALGVPMKALPGHLWHDVMTYCERQWMSSYTYDGIRLRLLAEDALGATPSAEAPGEAEGGAALKAASALEVNMSEGEFISVVATVNLTERAGEILYVNPVARALTHASAAETSGVEIRVLDAQGQTLQTYPAHVKLNTCADPSADRTGVVDAFIPAQPEARQLALVVEGQVVDTFGSGGLAPSVSNLRRSEADEAAMSFEWDASAAAETSNVTYNVQVSTDEGQTWRTVAVGRDSPDVSIDRSQFPPGSRVIVRVIATDGFSSAVADTETFSVDE